CLRDVVRSRVRGRADFPPAAGPNRGRAAAATEGTAARGQSSTSVPMAIAVKDIMDTNEPKHCADSTAEPDWIAIRDQILLDPSIINLNTGSFGPLPRSVFDRVTELRGWLAAEPTHFFVRQAPPLLWHARECLAAFLGTTPQRL